MWPFWFLFLLPAFVAMNQGAVRLPLPKKWPIIWWFAFFLLSMMIGLRYEVGGDWFNYMLHIETAYSEPLFEAILKGDPAYKFLNWLAAQTDGGMVFVNSISAVIFSWGLVTFCRAQPRPFLALSVAIPYLVVVVAMGYTRQAISIGLVMVAIVALTEQKMSRYFIFMGIALLFHKSAIIMLPLVALSSAGNRWLKISLGAIIGALLYWFLVRDSAEKLMENYIDAEFNSAGAAIRIAMNAVPAILFLFFRKRFRLPKDENNFWKMMSLIALGFIVLLQLSPSSTAVDRLALYWIPLQIFVFSRLPDVLGRPGRANSNWVFLILLFYAAVLAVWLVFADNAYAWLPYRFFLWDRLWGFA